VAEHWLDRLYIMIAEEYSLEHQTDVPVKVKAVCHIRYKSKRRAKLDFRIS